MRYLLLALLLTSCGYESDCFDGCNQDAIETPTPKPTATQIGTPVPAQCEVNAVEPTPVASYTPTPTPLVTSTPIPPVIIKVIIYDVDIIYECKERSRHHGRHRH